MCGVFLVYACPPTCGLIAGKSTRGMVKLRFDGRFENSKRRVCFWSSERDVFYLAVHCVS